ncbi:MAG: hypothetical protein KIT16_24380, partial [Rhodospirillaceae bacterium]|nr:hypothetical protein [Rhodospirillaceae bacterium]
MLGLRALAAAAALAMSVGIGAGSAVAEKPEEAGTRLMKEERFGDLKLQMSEAEIRKVLRAQPS